MAVPVAIGKDRVRNSFFPFFFGGGLMSTNILQNFFTLSWIFKKSNLPILETTYLVYLHIVLLSFSSSNRPDVRTVGER